jgi:hypothetical protein
VGRPGRVAGVDTLTAEKVDKEVCGRVSACAIACVAHDFLIHTLRLLRT